MCIRLELSIKKQDPPETVMRIQSDLSTIFDEFKSHGDTICELTVEEKYFKSVNTRKPDLLRINKLVDRYIVDVKCQEIKLNLLQI